MESPKLPLQLRYMNILLAPIGPVIIYYLGWYGLPLVFYLALQNSLLKRTRFGGYDTSNVPETQEKAM